jgi:hypothetical protein
MRQVFLGDIDWRPAAIVRVANAGDIARVIAFARETDVEPAVRCGGHVNAGQSTTDGGLRARPTGPAGDRDRPRGDHHRRLVISRASTDP